jgi:hypothetical protein
LKLHIPEVIKRLLLQFQIRRQRYLLEKILRQVKIRRAIRRVARVEDQPQVIRPHLRKLRKLIQRIRKIAGAIIAHCRRRRCVDSDCHKQQRH